ncbi:phage tail tape measure protein [Riemerella columbipharyngis]|uniref:Phage tail tape measure protein, TP901 family, core region n=1 Tax=Riemerella columbipharyngis TaxID=1071918 RepID=A0A1G7FII6_9FLAO|nr:phage tail tape measure protein [Riemerella columbipharyngis]SDE75637.1 phage tail tape measure protein, TP901 family, core region [Riemerella columbipharyngis]
MAQQAKLTLLIDLADKLSAKLGKLEGKLAGFQSRMQKRLNTLSDKVSSKLGMSTDTLKKGLMVGIAAGAAALGALGVKSVQAAEKFNDAFLPIRQLNLDKSKGELDDYRNKIRDAAFEVGTNLSASTTAMYDLQSATGVYGDDAIAIFKKVAKYSVATGADLNDSMNSTTKAMKAFGLGVNDIDKLLESNAKTVQTGITTYDELAKVQTEYAGAASSAGQGVDTANKVFAMFTSVAKNSDVGANMAKTFFQGLGQQADKFKKVLNIDVFDKEGSMRQADDILKDIAGKFKGMNDKQITEAINKIGGPEGLRGALDKVKTGADDVIKTFDAFDSSKFNLDDALRNAQGDFGKMKELFANRLEIVLSKIGDAIIPPLLRLFEVLNPALDWLNKNVGWLIPVFTAFAGALVLAAGAMWILNSSIWANPVIWIIAGIAALIALIVYLCSKIEGWGNLWDYTVKFVKAVWNGFLADVKLAWLGAEDLLLSGIEKIMTAWYKLKGLWNKAEAAEGLAKIEKESNERAKQLNKAQELSTHYKLEAARNLDGALHSLKWKEDKKEEKTGNSTGTQNTGASLYGNTKQGGGVADGGNAKKKGNSVGNAVQKVTGASTQAKNINIKIEALHKGNNIIGNGGNGSISMKEYETMFNEMMMRIIRNAEMS